MTTAYLELVDLNHHLRIGNGAARVSNGRMRSLYMIKVGAKIPWIDCCRILIQAGRMTGRMTHYGFALISFHENL